jgi:hypothetical protein
VKIRRNEHADHEEQAEAVDVGHGEAKPVSRPLQEDMELEETEGVAQPVPPEVETAHVRQNGIDPVRVWPQHRPDDTRAWLRSRERRLKLV